MAPVCPDLLIEVFTFHCGALLGRELFTDPVLLLGRDPGADIVLPSTTVSRQHGRLIFDGSRLAIRDDGSTHGTRVNGEPVDDAIIGRFDEIQIGEFVLKVRLLAPRARNRPAQPTRGVTHVDALADPDWDDVEPADEPAPLTRGETELPADEPAPLGDTVGDLEDEDEEFVPAFSLAAQLLREERDSSGGAVEVLTLSDDTVEGAELVAAGETFLVGPDVGWLRRLRYPDLQKPHRLLRVAHGRCRVWLTPELRATVVRDRRRVTLDGAPTFDLSRGEILDVIHGARRYHVRFVSPPRRTRDNRPLWQRLRPTRTEVKAFGGSLGAHLGILILLGLLLPAEVTLADARTTDEGYRLVTIPSEEEPEPVFERPEPTIEKLQTNRRPRVGRAAGAERQQRLGSSTGGARGVLDTLNRHSNRHAPGSSVVRAVSNLTFSRTSGGFKVAGLQAAMPSSKLGVGSLGGGPGLGLTRDLIRHGGRLGRRTQRGVGGVLSVDELSERKPIPNCQLDRDEVQRVVNKHIGQVQQCYERELLKHSGLSGKIRIEWTIRANGTVKSVRQAYSSMKNPAVSRCIMAAIRTWRFRPSACGEVTVGYPFIFESLRF